MERVRWNIEFLKIGTIPRAQVDVTSPAKMSRESLPLTGVVSGSRDLPALPDRNEILTLGIPAFKGNLEILGNFGNIQRLHEIYHRNNLGQENLLVFVRLGGLHGTDCLNQATKTICNRFYLI